MPYAKNGSISRDPIEGGIEITEDQYNQALQGMLEGKVVTIDGGFNVDFPPSTETTPDPETLEGAKGLKLMEINNKCDDEIDTIRATYPETEVLSWPKQEAEARAFMTDANAKTPLIDAIATARGMTKAELAGRILDKSDAFAMISGAAIGKRQALETQINAATTIEQVDAISWTA